jgi:nitrogen fixation NifU-like protein
MDLEELYQDVILDHSRRPRNFGELPQADSHARGDNPVCGDEVTVYVKFGEQDKLDAISFTGQGCAICMASASMMTNKVKGRSRAESEALARQFNEMLTSEAPPAEHMGDLALLKGVRKFPVRVKCATLPWHALEQALRSPKGTV